MRWHATVALAAGLLWTSEASTIVHIRTERALDTKIANVHVNYNGPVSEPVSFTYGGCQSKDQTDAHHVVSRGVNPARSHRLVWILPQDTETGGCLSAWSESGSLLGRSAPQMFVQKRGKRGSVLPSPGRVAMSNETGFNVWGPWFDGVALLQSRNDSQVDVEAAKAKQVAIVGAGMGGLMTYLVLKQAGLNNVTLIEGSNRLGGRVRTEYLSGEPEDYVYQEMGPMRIPQTTVFNNVTYNISDQAIVFQLIDEMNRLNKAENPDLRIDLIPFIQSSSNGLVYFQGKKMENGLPPTRAEVAADPSLGPPAVEYPNSVNELRGQLSAALPGRDFVVNMTQNLWQAHADFLKDRGPDGMPGDRWSEFAFIVNYLKGSVTDANTISGGSDYSSYLEDLYYSIVFSSATTLKTIDKGMNRLPQSFKPLIEGKIKYGKKVERVQFDNKTDRLTLHWRGNYSSELESDEFDYAVIATPFPVVQRMRLPDMSYIMRNAIGTLHYASACKVALEYRTRFWEKLANPIYGSCSTSTDIPGIGSVCYPSYRLNSTGPGALLASYAIGPPYGPDWSSVPEEQHVQYVVDAMEEIHGQVARDEYTGKYSRVCWSLDEMASGGWASPTVGQHETYLPEYFKTHSHMIFVGEHTSYTHAWISAALESGVRGGVQLLLELGLVDEAKEAVDKWFARWISV